MSEEKELISRKNRSPSSIIKEILVSQFQIGEKFTSNRISRISGLSSGKCSGFLHRLSKIGFLKVEEKIFVEESNMTCYNYEIIKDPARISVHKFSRVQPKRILREGPRQRIFGQSHIISKFLQNKRSSFEKLQELVLFVANDLKEDGLSEELFNLAVQVSEIERQRGGSM